MIQQEINYRYPRRRGIRFISEERELPLPNKAIVEGFVSALQRMPGVKVKKQVTSQLGVFGYVDVFNAEIRYKGTPVAIEIDRDAKGQGDLSQIVIMELTQERLGGSVFYEIKYAFAPLRTELILAISEQEFDGLAKRVLNAYKSAGNPAVVS